jgi:microcystin-dependent protein
MVEEYLGAVKIFAGDYAPVGYAFAQGQTLAINQYTALFSLYGTTYGGNGVSNFLLPNLQSVLPIGAGNGQGLTPRVMGETGGADNVTLLPFSVPPHTHSFSAAGGAANTTSSTPGPSFMLGSLKTADGHYYAPANGSNLKTEPFSPAAISGVGGGLPHNNIQPSMGINYIICMSGYFPSRG